MVKKRRRLQWRAGPEEDTMADEQRPADRTLEALLREDRRFDPPPSFRRAASATDLLVYEEAERDPEAFWASFARELEWMREWDHVLEWQPPHARWFVGGRLNISANCLDRH